MDMVLDVVDVRVIGALLEKEITVPTTYPLTMNALLAACNQASGRDPILSLSAADVAASMDRLKSARLVRLVHASHGARSEKFRQVAHEVFLLDGPERAVLTLLLLRGPQTPGELRARGERLWPFASLDEVDAALRALAGRDQPLVRQLDRQAGHKESRWQHLLSGDGPLPASGSGAAAAVAAVSPSAEEPSAGPEVAALAPFIGRWSGAGAGEYPTIEGFVYTEEIELRPVPGKAIVAYRSSTRSADDGRALHGESGFLRLVGDGGVELVVAHGFGAVEVAEGFVDDRELSVSSTLVAGTATAKSVTLVQRSYRVEGDALTYELAMAAVGRPLTHHLRARLTRST